MRKKIYPKISKQLSAVVANEDGVHLNVLALDTSSAEVSIQCDIGQRNVMTPGGSYVRGGKLVELSISLELPDENGQVSPIEARCHIAYSRRISRDLCKIGMRYVDMGKNDYNRLIQFIEKTQASSSGFAY
ncbi:PilZ domain-containing protein [Methylobacter sp. YRD-M1]|uniref:PilZ domain-containing protein n=1 Tax=Methylobacter sp. YRD-M1 TaxID=2911520 RepID=UPI00227D3C63|nr:PilZ domain-containing protein [Methylobacter sp. YRD-M1]WAK03032.1 PilZ domain-containing protein [Methylobacter sp. YRD-M1]